MEFLQPRAEASLSEEAMDTASPTKISRQEGQSDSDHRGSGVAPASAVGAAQQTKVQPSTPSGGGGYGLPGRRGNIE